MPRIPCVLQQYVADRCESDCIKYGYHSFFYDSLSAMPNPIQERLQAGRTAALQTLQQDPGPT